METFTQEQVNGLVAQARSQGNASGQKELLKALGFSSLEDAQADLKTLRETAKAQQSEVDRLKAENTELGTKVTAAATEVSAATTKYKVVALERAAEKIGEELGVTAARTLQIVKLLDLKADDFNPEDNKLKEQFSTFLGLPENKHFVGDVVTASTTGGARKPGAPSTTGEPDKLDKLSSLLRF